VEQDSLDRRELAPQKQKTTTPGRRKVPPFFDTSGLREEEETVRDLTGS